MEKETLNLLRGIEETLVDALCTLGVVLDDVEAAPKFTDRRAADAIVVESSLAEAQPLLRKALDCFQDAIKYGKRICD